MSNIQAETKKLFKIFQCKGLIRYRDVLIDFRSGIPNIEYTISEFAWGFVKNPFIANRVAEQLRKILPDIHAQARANVTTTSPPPEPMDVPEPVELEVKPTVWEETLPEFQNQFAGFSESLLLEEPLSSESDDESLESRSMEVIVVTEDDFRRYSGSDLLDKNAVPDNQRFWVYEDESWAEDIWKYVEDRLPNVGLSYTPFVFHYDQGNCFRPRIVLDEFAPIGSYDFGGDGKIYVFLAPFNSFDEKNDSIVHVKFFCNDRYLCYKECKVIHKTDKLYDIRFNTNNKEIFLFEEVTPTKIDRLEDWLHETVDDASIETGDIVIYSYEEKHNTVERIKELLSFSREL